MMYRQALVEVNDNGHKYISTVPWGTFLMERFLNIFKLVNYPQHFSVRLLMPWEWTSEKNYNKNT